MHPDPNLMEGHVGRRRRGCYHCKNFSEPCFCPANDPRCPPHKISGTRADTVVLDEVGLGSPLGPKAQAAIGENLADAILRGDVVNLPDHYARFAIEPLRYAMENRMNPLQAKIAKYTARFDAKNGLEDLGKGVRCCIMLLRFAAGDPDWWKPDPYTPQIIEAYGKPANVGH